MYTILWRKTLKEIKHGCTVRAHRWVDDLLMNVDFQSLFRCIFFLGSCCHTKLGVECLSIQKWWLTQSWYGIILCHQSYKYIHYHNILIIYSCHLLVVIAFCRFSPTKNHTKSDKILVHHFSYWNGSTGCNELYIYAHNNFHS